MIMVRSTLAAFAFVVLSGSVAQARAATTERLSILSNGEKIGSVVV
ncbi:hypothetical protein SAMN05518849_1127 [Sphingobium sp. AP50]|nr:hypothetical protein [Sphingobium sp. AP50]SEJ72364.1 hypothetical protein SAMN05518849_1127 [Sphingobium sp. AP50]